eukprot:15366285-Ditylum_brightwellii.AAC.1
MQPGGNIPVECQYVLSNIMLGFCIYIGWLSGLVGACLRIIWKYLLNQKASKIVATKEEFQTDLKKLQEKYEDFLKTKKAQGLGVRL